MDGVVVITSKRGLSMDKAKITLRAQYGFSELAQTNWKMMNTDERITGNGFLLFYKCLFILIDELSVPAISAFLRKSG